VLPVSFDPLTVNDVVAIGINNDSKKTKGHAPLTELHGRTSQRFTGISSTAGTWDGCHESPDALGPESRLTVRKSRHESSFLLTVRKSATTLVHENEELLMNFHKDH